MQCFHSIRALHQFIAPLAIGLDQLNKLDTQSELLESGFSSSNFHTHEGNLYHPQTRHTIRTIGLYHPQTRHTIRTIGIWIFMKQFSYPCGSSVSSTNSTHNPNYCNLDLYPATFIPCRSSIPSTNSTRNPNYWNVDLHPATFIPVWIICTIHELDTQSELLESGSSSRNFHTRVSHLYHPQTRHTIRTIVRTIGIWIFIQQLSYPCGSSVPSTNSTHNPNYWSVPSTNSTHSPNYWNPDLHPTTFIPVWVICTIYKLDHNPNYRSVPSTNSTHGPNYWNLDLHTATFIPVWVICTIYKLDTQSELLESGSYTATFIPVWVICTIHKLDTQSELLDCTIHKLDTQSELLESGSSSSNFHTRVGHLYHPQTRHTIRTIGIWIFIQQLSYPVGHPYHPQTRHTIRTIGIWIFIQQLSYPCGSSVPSTNSTHNPNYWNLYLHTATFIPVWIICTIHELDTQSELLESGSSYSNFHTRVDHLYHPHQQPTGQIDSSFHMYKTEGETTAEGHTELPTQEIKFCFVCVYNQSTIR
ncbi:hypothetical protein PoB_001654800 [Plakobranchus ocellatus]|uniref:Uncharacterized protein n=1 Tax=Plakobranchus ocellatus TaxID=259542 RepID=A0AAV3Z5W2_9GAST|nr:hypothetical protein PoB_001654800 [Plakobranchus ocellatus]